MSDPDRDDVQPPCPDPDTAASLVMVGDCEIIPGPGRDEQPEEER